MIITSKGLQFLVELKRGVRVAGARAVIARCNQGIRKTCCLAHYPRVSGPWDGPHGNTMVPIAWVTHRTLHKWLWDTLGLGERFLERVLQRRITTRMESAKEKKKFPGNFV